MTVLTRLIRTDRTGSRKPRGARALGRAPGIPLLGLLPLIAVVLVWQVFGGFNDFTFPRPDRWWHAFMVMVTRGEILPALQQTMLIFVLGLFFSIVLGVGLGWALGASRRLERALNPTLDYFRSLPAPALIPVAIVLLGVTLNMSVVVMVIAVNWPILLNAASSRRQIPGVRLEMARVLGMSRTARAWKIVLPSMLPDIMTGVRTAASIGLVSALVIDILGSGSGIGLLLVTKQQTFDAASVWALLVIVGLLGTIVNAVVAAIDKKVQQGR